MKVSIIIPTYNEESVISDCLVSLSKQTYKDIEIIVVDDGSADRTVEKCQVLNVKCQILRQEHMGPGAARNLGARHVKGDILVFVDADMTFDKNFVENLVAPIIKGKTIGTFSKEEYLLNKDNLWARLWNLNRWLPEDRMHSKDYPGRQKVFRAILKKEFERVGGFDEKTGYTDDWSLSEKLGVEAMSVPRAIFYHRNPNSLKEVFIQSKWMAKRKYKFGFIGMFISLLRTSLPVSFLVGILKSIRFRTPAFFVFKIISDAGVFLGILEYSLLRKSSK